MTRALVYLERDILWLIDIKKEHYTTRKSMQDLQHAG